MATKSNNTKGNPYHDESDGKFTSADGVGEGKAAVETVTNAISLKPNADLSPLKGTRLKLGVAAESISERFRDLNQSMNIPKLTSARDIESHITEFFSKQVIGKIDSLYGSTTDCASYQFHPKSNPYMTLEIFPNVLGKYRYRDNHARIVSASEFTRILTMGLPNGKERIWRGISSNGEKARGIIGSYGKIDLENFDYYCPNGGNCYGSNIYTTVDRSYAYSYSGYNGTLIEGILDSRNSWSMSYDYVRNIMNGIDQEKVRASVAEHLEKSGLDQARAQRIASSFAKAVKTDVGTVGILMGLDYYVSSGHQRNLLNLSKWTIKEV